MGVSWEDRSLHKLEELIDTDRFGRKFRIKRREHSTITRFEGRRPRKVADGMENDDDYLGYTFSVWLVHDSFSSNVPLHF